jgi:hypothetical protein
MLRAHAVYNNKSGFSLARGAAPRRLSYARVGAAAAGACSGNLHTTEGSAYRTHAAWTWDLRETQISS